MRHPKALTAAIGIGMIAASVALAPAASAAPAPLAPPSADAPRYDGGGGGSSAQQREESANRAFFVMVWEKAQAKQDAKPGVQAVTVTYDASGAPTFASQIAASTGIWNNAVDNVTLASGGGGSDFSYEEGNDPRGSFAYTDGRGSGYVFLDYAQNQTYDSTRVTTHETGHVLGLPDNYSGPCSELMSGGGPGPSCTNAQPDAAERSAVEQIWGSLGFLSAQEAANAAFGKD